MDRIVVPTISTSAQTVEVGALLDRARFGPLQTTVFVVGLLCMTFEGYDTYAVSYIGPSLRTLWQLSAGTLGVLFTAGTAASALAYAAIGPVADRMGRRGPVIFGTAAFGAASILSATASSAAAFIAWRVLTGLALGAVLPNIVAIAAEMTPARRRSWVVVVLYSGFAIGSALSGLLAGHLMPRYGWGSVLVVGGIVPLLLAVVMVARLPESPRFLAVAEPRGLRLRLLLQRIAGPQAVPAGCDCTLQGEHLRREPIQDLFRDGRATSTLMIWLVLTMDVTTIGALVFWIPTILNTAGQSAAQGINFSVVLLLGGIVGAFLIGWCMDRFGTYRILIPAHLCALAFVATFALTVGTSPVLLAFLIGLTLNGGTSGSQGLLARLYPTSLRATGVGWASGFSRFVGIAQPLLMGVLLSAGGSARTALLLCSVPMLASALALTVLSRDPVGRHARQARTS